MKRFSPHRPLAAFARACACFAAILLAGSCARAPDAPQSTITLDSCRLHGVEGAVGCGTCGGGEDRAGKKGRRIKLALAVIPARTRAREPDAIVVFAGG